MRLLVLYYSQSGQSKEAAESFAKPWSEVAQVSFHPIVPEQRFPYPWGSLLTFFGVMPDCILGHCRPLCRPESDLTNGYDLIVLSYPVWFLSPALPVQSIFQDERYLQAIQGMPLITICVSRKMWHNAAQRMKKLLAQANCRQLDNVTVTHQGNFWATLISTPRSLLVGSDNQMWGVFPKAGISDEDHRRLTQLGEAAVQRSIGDACFTQASLLAGLPATSVKKRFIIPELVAWYAFYASAVTIDAAGRVHSALRATTVCFFIVFLVTLIVLVLPILLVASWILHPIVDARVTRYAKCLAEPTGEYLVEPTGESGTRLRESK